MARIVRDPSPSELKKQILYSALVIIGVGVVIFIFAKVFVGVVIVLLGAVFGLGSQVSIKQDK